jgi:hypothetical protein
LTKKAKAETFASFYLGISLAGLVLLAVSMYILPASEEKFTWQTQLTGLIFAAICLFGTEAALFPSRCLRVTHFRKKMTASGSEKKLSGSGDKTITFEGHHPACGNFSSHVIFFNGKSYCAGCTGLATGAVLSFVGGFLYFFGGLGLGETSVTFFWLGFFGAACGLLQYKLLTSSSIMHFFFNVVFVLGAFLLLAGVDSAKGSLVVNVYLLVLIVYWINTRIVLSQTEHGKICQNCKVESCSIAFGN